MPNLFFLVPRLLHSVELEIFSTVATAPPELDNSIENLVKYLETLIMDSDADLLDVDDDYYAFLNLPRDVSRHENLL